MPSPFSTTMSSEPVPPDPTEQYIHPDDPDDEWAAAPTGRGVRVRVITGALLVLAVLAGGFWGGVVAEKHHGGSSSASTAASALASRFAALRGSAGSGSGASAASGTAGRTAAGATTGLVTEVQGNILYVTENDAAGTLVKVTVGSSTTVTRTAKSSLSGLQQGDTVVVSGSKAANGAVSATAIRATGQGVTTGGGVGGFGSGGGFGGGSGTGAAGGAGGSGG